MHERALSRRSFLTFLVSVPVLVTLPSGLVVAARIRVAALRHWPDPEKTRLVVDLDGAARFETRVLRNPHRIVLEIAAAELRGSIDRTFTNDPYVQGVGARQKDGVVELVIELARASELNAFPLPPNEVGRGHRIVIDVAPRLTADEEARKQAEIVEVRESGDRVVAIDPGHGGEDPGTVWGTSLEEKAIALDVARLLAKQLGRANGLRPILTRSGDYFVPLQKRQEIARQYGAQLFLSLHVNAARSRQARGAEIFFLSLKGAADRAARELVDRENAADLVGGVPPDQVNAPIVDILMDMTRNHTMKDSERLATLLLQRLSGVRGGAVRGVKQGPLAVLKSIDKPSVLIELGFFTNSTDRKLLADPRAHRQYAKQLANGIADYLS
ncbi:MAG: N-acetylmuramoyl-L-alanine amidase [Candidatus Krumholzibacteriia bacterium]